MHGSLPGCWDYKSVMRHDSYPSIIYYLVVQTNIFSGIIQRKLFLYDWRESAQRHTQQKELNVQICGTIFDYLKEINAEGFQRKPESDGERLHEGEGQRRKVLNMGS